MKSKKKAILISLSFLMLIACGSKKKQFENKDLAPNYSSQRGALKAFEAANAKFDKDDFAGAAKAYDKIMLDKPVSTLDGLIIFNAGLAYHMTGDCRTAVRKLRKVIRFAQKRKAEALILRAKLRLSDSYACLGLVNRSMVLLSEIFKQRRKLSPAIGNAEVPAKLAAGYSRLGNRKMADYYFKLADQGLRLLENTNLDTKEQNNLLSKTLFTMGDTSQVKFDMTQYDSYFRTLRTLQKYLLRSISYQIEPWSTKAVSQILIGYEKTWKMVEAVEAPQNMNETRGGRAVKVKRAKIIQSALETLRDLEKEKLPSEKSVQIADLFKRLQKTKLKMRNYLVAEAPGSELTEEAKYLQGPKREGQVKSGQTILERKKNKK